MLTFKDLEADLKGRVTRALAAGEKPLILLDVDDTLIDCRYRKSLVFRDFCEVPEHQERWPAECAQLRGLSWEKLVYRVHDNLKTIAIENPAFAQTLFDYWIARYFTYPYLLLDRPFPGAIDFVKHCLNWGAHIIYLTARDVEGMLQGTEEAFQKLGFPMTDRCRLMLKEDKSQSDHDFKRDALETIAGLGTVVGSLENELGNLNTMAERFPDAAMYWRKTLYSPNPPPPHPNVLELRVFPSESLSDELSRI